MVGREAYDVHVRSCFLFILQIFLDLFHVALVKELLL